MLGLSLASLCLPSVASAVPLVSWSISGPAASSATQTTATTWMMDYSLSVPEVFSTQTWTVSATARAVGEYEFEWSYSGFHVFFDVEAFLNEFSPADTTDVYSGGPADCCTSPSAGFNESGTFVFTGLGAGDSFASPLGPQF